MKYIRTKDGVYEVKSWHDYDLSGRVYETMDKQHIDTIEVMKVAATIEELCDEFVVIKGDCKCLYKPNDIFDCQDKNAVNELIKNNAIYGAIWTDKGLIYVAKMNEKGELKLL